MEDTKMVEKVEPTVEVEDKSKASMEDETKESKCFVHSFHSAFTKLSKYSKRKLSSHGSFAHKKLRSREELPTAREISRSIELPIAREPSNSIELPTHNQSKASPRIKLPNYREQAHIELPSHIEIPTTRWLPFHQELSASASGLRESQQLQRMLEQWSVSAAYQATILSSINRGLTRLPIGRQILSNSTLAMSGLGADDDSILGVACRQQQNAFKPPAVKKYRCDECGKAFSRSNTLVTHKRIHSGEKPFECELCGRAFRQPGNLTRHKLTHTTLKPYVCPTCGKAFNRASNLHTHMRTHSTFTPHVCYICSKQFQNRVDLHVHLYSHQGVLTL